MDNNSFATIYSHDRECGTACVCIPTTDEIESNRYQCGPAPKVQPSVLPVISPRQLTHYFLKPHTLTEPQRIIFNQLPKRACGQLTLSPDEPQYGWGLHLKEGWNWDLICFIIFVLLIVGGVVIGFVWAATQHDIPSAVAIATFWITLGSILLGYIAARNAS